MRIFLGKGVRFLLSGRSYEITKQINRDEFEAKDLEFEGVTRNFTRTSLIDNLDKGMLVFSVKGKNTQGDLVQTSKYDDYTMLPEHVRDVVDFRLYVINPLLSLEGSKHKGAVACRVEEIKKEGYRRVSRASVYRWLKDYRESEGNLYSLVPQFDSRGSEGPRLNGEVEIIMDQVIEELNAKKEKFDLRSVWEEIIFRIDLENKQRSEDLKMNFPSRSTVRRRYLKKDPSKVAKKKKGSLQAHGKFGNVNPTIRPTRPLQRVEIDHTPLDLIVVDEVHRLPIGRPTLTVCKDVYTSYPLGMYVGYEPPSYTSVMHALSHSISPKTYMKETYPEVEHEWLAYGIPELLVMDNGREFHSRHLTDACLRLGIETYHCPVKKAWYKGSIERFFRTTTGVVHSMPGTTFSNILERAGYDSKKFAIISLSTFLKVMHLWIVDYYAEDFHKGVIPGIPSRLWSRYFSEGAEPAIPSSKIDWKIALLKIGKGSIQRAGIQRENLHYQSDHLQELKERMRRKGMENSVQFKYDPSDLSKIFVYDELEKIYIETLCTDQDYSYGLNEFAHKMIVKQLREEKASVSYLSLARTKAKIREMLGNDYNLTMTERRKKNRMNNKGSNQLLENEKTVKEDSGNPLGTSNRKGSSYKKKDPSNIVSISDEIDYTKWGVYHANG